MNHITQKITRTKNRAQVYVEQYFHILFMYPIGFSVATLLFYALFYKLVFAKLQFSLIHNSVIM